MAVLHLSGTQGDEFLLYTDAPGGLCANSGNLQREPDIRVKIARVGRKQVRVTFDAPPSVLIVRGKILQKMQHALGGKNSA